MKKNKAIIKTGLSLFLVFAILMCSALPIFAADECNCGENPLIHVSGMNTFPLYENYGEPNQKQLFTPPAEEIVKAVPAIVCALLKFSVNKDYDEAADTIFPEVKNLLDPIGCNLDGTSRLNITTPTFNQPMSEYKPGETLDYNGTMIEFSKVIGEDHTYFFNYDWRLDPFVNAKLLKEMIDNVKSRTGHSKVRLTAESMGGVVTVAYLSEYGSADISDLVFLSAAFSGVELVGDIFNGRLETNEKALKEFINVMLSTGGYESLKIIVSGVEKAGLLNVLAEFITGFIKHSSDRIYSEAIADNMLTMPGIWALVPIEEYEGAKSFLLNETEDAKLIEMSDKYHYNCQAKIKEILDDTMNSGTHLSILSHYNLQGVPFIKSIDSQTDHLIDTKHTSLFATAAPLEKKLSDDYLSKNPVCQNGHKHISGDLTIDASTCLFPEQTWFLKNISHASAPPNTEISKLIVWLVTYKTQPTVDSIENYPQFMEVVDNSKLIPVKVNSEDVSTTIPSTETTAINQDDTTTQVQNDTNTTNEDTIKDSENLPKTGGYIKPVIGVGVMFAVTASVIFLIKKKSDFTNQ